MTYAITKKEMGYLGEDRVMLYYTNNPKKKGPLANLIFAITQTTGSNEKYMLFPQKQNEMPVYDKDHNPIGFMNPDKMKPFSEYLYDKTQLNQEVLKILNPPPLVKRAKDMMQKHKNIALCICAIATILISYKTAKFIQGPTALTQEEQNYVNYARNVCPSNPPSQGYCDLYNQWKKQKRVL